MLAFVINKLLNKLIENENFSQKTLLQESKISLFY
jgi:hypothetical protein